MDARKIVIIIGVITAVTFPFWELIPAVSYLFEIILAAAILLITFERGLRYLMPALAAGLLLGVLPDLAPMPFFFYLPIWLKVVVPPMTLGIFINHGTHAGRSFAAASLLTATFVMMLYIRAGPILAEQITALSESLTGLIATTLSSQGYDSEFINELTDGASRFLYWVKTLLPGILIMSGVGQLFISFLLLDWYYTRRDSYFPGFGPFIYWKIPEKLLYLLAAALLVALALKGAWKVASYNTIFILAIFYAVCGLALIEHLLRKLRLPLAIKILFYLGLLLMQMPGLIITSVAGLVDSHFDFRRVRAHTLG